MPTAHGSAVLRGVASRTQNLPLVALTSVSEVSQTIHASCIGENSADTAIELPAYGTAVVQACTWKGLPDASLNTSSSLLADSPSLPIDHAISLKTDSVPGSFYTFGFALNGGIGQAQLQPLDFYDPGMLGSSSLVYVGVPIGAVPLLAASLSAPVLTLANFSDQPRTTSVTLSDSSSGTPKVQQIAQVKTAAFSTQTLNLNSGTASGILNTLTINSDGTPGDVQAHLFTRIGTSEQRTELLVKDSRDDHNGGDHPWSIDNGNTSTLLLYNSSAKPQEFQVRISGSASSWIEIYQLAPYETRSMSINDIVARRLPDHAKHTLPEALLNGEVQWSTQFGSSGLGRMLVTNSTTSLARSFSCELYYNMCWATFGPDNFIDIPLDGYGTLSSVTPLFCAEYCSNCCYLTSPVGETYSYTTQWEANAPQTQTMYLAPYAINLQGVSVGSFSVSASVTAGSCQAGPLNGGGNVFLATVVNFHQTIGRDNGDGTLGFEYHWDSSTGNLADLSQCTVREYVTYPGTGNYVWSSPPYAATTTDNPTLGSTAATGGVGNDIQYGPNGFRTPYVADQFTANQKYQFQCSNYNSGAWNDLVTGIAIVRTVSYGDTWNYVITKSGVSASINPLP